MLRIVFVGLTLSVGLLAQEISQDHAGQYPPESIDRGSRVYGVNCAFCHGPNGDSIAGVDLKSGKFRNAKSDEDLAKVITSGVSGTAMPPHKLSLAELTGVIAYIRNMREFSSAGVPVGNAAAGKAVFAGKGGCTQCHRVNGDGGRSGPDLSDIGSIRSAYQLQQKFADPTATMLPQNRSVRAVTKSGQTITGRRLNEDTYSVQLIDAKENLVTIDKSQLKEFTVQKTSPMPSFKDKLTAQETADLIGYLLSLKGLN